MTITADNVPFILVALPLAAVLLLFAAEWAWKRWLK